MNNIFGFKKKNDKNFENNNLRITYYTYYGSYIESRNRLYAGR